MDRTKFEKAKEIDDEICKCDNILKAFADYDNVAFRDGDKVNGCARRNSSTTGELFEAIISVAEQYIIGRRESLEDEFDKL